MMSSQRPLVLGVALEERFYSLPNGTIYSPSGFSDSFWQRYLIAFEEVRIIARLSKCDRPKAEWAKITDKRVSISPVLSFLGPIHFFMNMPLVLISFIKAAKLVDVLLVRAPGSLSLLYLISLSLGYFRDKPLAVELVGDPFDVFSPSIVGNLAFVLRPIFVSSTKIICRKCQAVSYVTQTYLQSRYPALPDSYKVACSSVEIATQDFASYPRDMSYFYKEKSIPTIFVAASLEFPYKGIDTLLKSTQIIVDSGDLIRVRIAGSGRLFPELERLATTLGLNEFVAFLGKINRQNVLSEMRSAHLYVQPSLTEGLPRSIIEAFSQSSPVIASNVGGIPELLDPKDIFEPGNPKLLAKKIKEVVFSPERLACMSARNLAVSHEYSKSVLDNRRSDFYLHLRECTISLTGF